MRRELLVASLLVSGSAFAAGPDLSAMTPLDMFGSITAAILLVGISALAVVVLISAVRDVYRMIKGV